MKDTMRIGTLVGGGDAVRVIPQIVGHGFESFSLTFWQTTGKQISWKLESVCKSLQQNMTS